MESMKVHNFARGRFWEHETLSLTLGCKHLHPLAPKISNSNITTTTSSFDLKSFIKSESGSKKLGPSYDDNKRDSPSPKDQVETHGGTRWNPTQEQIRILEMLYRGGMRTPNTQKIEQITVQLSKYGKIEGKNVFYWFQNHKARERQKQKRKTLSLPLTPHTLTFTLPQVEVDQEDSSYKKCRSMAFEYFEDQNWSSCKNQEHKTLELFPLHPELGK